MNLEQQNQPNELLHASFYELPDAVQRIIKQETLEITEAFPQRKDRLNSLRFLIEDANNRTGTEASYDVDIHGFIIDPRLVKRMEEAEAEIEKIKVEHAILHELTHAVSYRKVERKEPYREIFSGVLFQKGSKDMKVVQEKRYFLNEGLTNYFTFQIMQRKSRPAQESTIVDHSLKLSRGFEFFEKLKKLVGMTPLEQAYFDGEFFILVEKLREKGVNASDAFSYIEKDDYHSANNILDRALKRLSREIE